MTEQTDPTKPTPNSEKFKPQNVADPQNPGGGQGNPGGAHDIPRGSEGEAQRRSGHRT